MQGLVGSAMDPIQAAKEKAIRDARAAILWGDNPDEVLEKMIKCGVDPETAQAELNSFMSERAMEVRRKGIKKVIIGAVVAAISIGVLAVMILSENFSMVMAAPGGFALVGIYLLIDGLLLTLTGSMRGSVTE